MGAKHLSERSNWQEEARTRGDLGENKVVEALAAWLPSHYRVDLKPPKIQIYSNGKGIVLDAQIYNTQTEKCLFVESKRGDNGGNATEERSYKFATPGMKKAVREVVPDVCDEPFFTIYSGKNFNGNGDQLPYVHQWTTKSGKRQKKTITPADYREKVKTAMYGQNYAIADHEFSNAQEIAQQIMEII